MAPHGHILSRISEAMGVLPNGIGTSANDTVSSTNSSIGSQVKKEGDEVRPDGEERQEIKIANMILRAASGLAKSPAQEEIIKQAEELKRLHGIQ